MTDDLKDIYSQFKKSELLEVASELEIDDINPGVMIRNICQAIIDDINENGLPEDLAEISDDLYEFLIVAEYIDEDGNILDRDAVKEDTETISKDEVPEEVEIPDWKCFSYYESRDPACKKCNLAEYCKPARIARRPECFGLSYDPNDAECRICIEAPYCKVESAKEK